MGPLALAITLAAHTVGAFSRATHGRYTPSFYAYQVDRAPNTASTWFIPAIDLVLVALMLNKGTRTLGASLSALMQFFGVIKRVREDKDAVVDLVLLCFAVVAALDYLFPGL